MDVIDFKKRIEIKSILVATGISIILFVLLTAMSFFLTAVGRVNFKIGLPWTFYYQLLIDCEIQHGSNILNFIKDIFTTWVLSAVFWLFLIQKKAGSNQ